MAITRRQFVTRLGALAAAAGFSQVEVTKIMDAMAYSATGTAPYKGTFGKPRVVWLHGAECTGCSTSLLGIFENVNGEAVVDTGISTGTALGIAGTYPNADVDALLGHSAGGPTLAATGNSPEPAGAIDIADVVVDVIDLLYHETIQGSGGDLAYKWLVDFAASNSKPFVLVVEGAMQVSTLGGAWGDVSDTSVAWCSIAHADDPLGGDIVTSTMVRTLAMKPECAAVIAIGQCATFGGYPACKPPINQVDAGFDPTHSQTDAMGVFKFLSDYANVATANKVINAPGCPTNPWWFVLTTVLFLVDVPSLLSAPVGTAGTLGTLKKVAVNANNGLGIEPNGAAVDGDRRLNHVYGIAVHSTHCPRYQDFNNGVFAAKPGDAGCLQKLGCKGPSTSSLCGVHGWNGQQPTNVGTWDNSIGQANPNALGGFRGGHCTRAGHPCMACTEHGYPDAFVPFIARS